MKTLLLSLGVVSTVFLVEMVVAGVHNSSLLEMIRRPRNSQWTDVFCFLFYGTGFFDKAIFLGSFGLSAVVLHGTRVLFRYTLPAKLPLDLGDPLFNLVVYYILGNFLSYWNHRVFHSGIWWNFHRYHHAATAMSPLVEHRNHPMQHAIDGGLFALPLAVISMRPDYVAMLAVANQFHQLIVHSNIRSSWGWVGKWVLVSPLVHRLHHSINPNHHNLNFSDGLVLWDRIFGTYSNDFDGIEEIGVSGIRYNEHGPLYDILADYIRAARELGGGSVRIFVSLIRLPGRPHLPPNIYTAQNNSD